MAKVAGARTHHLEQSNIQENPRPLQHPSQCSQARTGLHISFNCTLDKQCLAGETKPPKAPFSAGCKNNIVIWRLTLCPLAMSTWHHFSKIDSISKIPVSQLRNTGPQALQSKTLEVWGCQTGHSSAACTLLSKIGNAFTQATTTTNPSPQT